MALDPVPWIIAGGASHSADVARAMAFVALGGKEGVIGVGSGKVSAGGGGNVSVAAGAFAIENTYPGVSQQMYVAREASSTLVAVPATGAGATRSDMLVVTVDDPQFGASSSLLPAGPFVKYELISNVGAGATQVPGSFTKPALPLARIDLPVSTSTITAAMIVDLRGDVGVAGVAQYKKLVRSHEPTSSVTLTTAAPGTAWPYATGWTLAIPTWATKMSARATLAGIRGDHHATLNNYGKLWIVVGNPAVITGVTTKYEVQEGPGGQERHNFITGFADTAVPSSARGTSQLFRVFGQREGASGGPNLIADTNSTIFLDVEFFEEPA